MLRVVDKHGQPIVNVTADQLKAEIDGNSAHIISFAQLGKPAVILLLDGSGSMRGSWKEILVAAKQLMDIAREQFALFVFRDRIESSATDRSKSEALLDELSKKGPPQGVACTALYDTLVEVAGRVRTSNAAIVVISDGGDNCSRHSPDETVSQFLRSSWPAVFGLIVEDEIPTLTDRQRKRFHKISDATGGLVLYPSSGSKIPAKMGELAGSVLNPPFALTLQPSGSKTDMAKLKLAFIGSEGHPQKDITLLHVAEIAGCDKQRADHH
jgi:hypothetical protein